MRLELLSAATKLFFKRPAEMQHMLGRLLEAAIAGEPPPPYPPTHPYPPMTTYSPTTALTATTSYTCLT